MPKDPLRLNNDGSPLGGKVLSARFIVAILLFVVGIAWIAWYYLALRPSGGEFGSPKAIAELERWNYVIGFGLAMLGLVVSAHKSTPMGRGRGVIVGMLGCFLVGLIWICIFYIFSNDISSIPVFNDLNQSNLIVGIALMAVGFTFATKWE